MKNTDYINGYKAFRKSITLNGVFYKWSLRRSSSFFDVTKFITDPWPGNQESGKDFLNGVVHIRDFYEHADILNSIFCTDNVNDVDMYINSFAWIRDLQAVGGFEMRKFVRNAVETFIQKYRSTSYFWKQPLFDTLITSERIINWLYAYSFFALGASDRFQKYVLSSITEQLSHIIKVYKYETDYLTVLSALRTIISCYSFGARRFNVLRYIKKIEKVIAKCFSSDWIYITYNPDAQFFILKLLLEIRFVIKNTNNITFFNALPKIAQYVRFARMSNGYLAYNIGEFSYYQPVFNAKSNLIDAVLSLTDIQTEISNYNEIGIYNFTNNNKSVVINTRDMQNYVFPSEISFDSQKIINITNCAMYKDKNSLLKDSINKIFVDNSDEMIECEIIGKSNIYGSFAIRREIKFDDMYDIMNINEIFYCKNNANALVQIVLHRNAEVTRDDNNKATIMINNNVYKFISSHPIIIRHADIFTHPVIYIREHVSNNSTLSITWQIKANY